MTKFVMTLVAAASLMAFAAAQQADCCAEKAPSPKAKEAKAAQAKSTPKAKATDECADCKDAAKAPKAKAAAHQKAAAKAHEVQASAQAAECQDCDEMAKTAKADDECCKSTAAKPLKVGDPGCCNNANELAKFKLFVVGKGYAYFGCEDSAGKARDALVKKGEFVGAVQKVASKVKIGKGVKV